MQPPAQTATPPTPSERAKWRRQPVWFATQRLGEKPTQAQNEILHALRDHQYVAVEAPNGSGKTYAAALAAIWWLMAYDDAIVITTAPTERQVRQLVWREIHSIYRRNRKFIGGNITKTGLELGHRNFAFGFSTNSAERFQGFHARNILFIADEASGINEKIYEAIHGSMTSQNAKLLIIGNRTKPKGTFHQAFNKQKNLWKTIQTQTNNPQSKESNPDPKSLSRA